MKTKRRTRMLHDFVRACKLALRDFVCAREQALHDVVRARKTFC